MLSIKYNVLRFSQDAYYSFALLNYFFLFFLFFFLTPSRLHAFPDLQSKGTILFHEAEVIILIVNDIAGFREENHKRKEEERARESKAWRYQFLHSPLQRAKQHRENFWGF